MIKSSLQIHFIWRGTITKNKDVNDKINVSPLDICLDYLATKKKMHITAAFKNSPFMFSRQWPLALHVFHCISKLLKQMTINNWSTTNPKVCKGGKHNVFGYIHITINGQINIYTTLASSCIPSSGCNDVSQLSAMASEI